MVLLLSAISNSNRSPKLQEFYRKLGDHCEETTGTLYLSDVDGTLDWPNRGIYVFFSPDTNPEINPVKEWKIRRIGTVGDCKGSSSTLWERLRAHRGNKNGKYAGGGNHRGSVFRRHVGRALIEKDELQDRYPHWGIPHRNIPEDIDTTTLREQEHQLEEQISNRIRNLPFTVINIPGDPGPDCDRARIEKNLIALTSHARRTNPELRSDDWIGRHVPHAEIAKTGLWNVDHTNAFYTNNIINELDPYIDQTTSIKSD